MEGTNWHFYLKTEDAWLSMKEACFNARKTIDIEQYILEDDDIGNEFLDLFKEKNKQGVKVRILCDMAGSFSFYNSNLPKELVKAGIEVRFFNIISPWRIRSFFSWFFRDHRKIMVVDGGVGFIGGVGIRSDMENWRDTHLKVLGDITKEMSESFQEMWESAGEKSLIKRIKKARGFSKGFQFLTNSPHFKKRFLYRAHIDAIKNAKEKIYLTTPYFIPDKKLSRVLKKASAMGVDVKILVPKYSNYFWVDRASQSTFEKLLNAGVEIYRYSGEMMHAKTTVIDSSWATVGSFNLDSLSFLFNYEANIVSNKKSFVEEVEKYFFEDLEKSEKIDLKRWKNRSAILKFYEFLALPMKRFL